MTSAQELLKTKNGGRFGRELRKEFLFEDGYVNLNHGEFASTTLNHIEEYFFFQISLYS